MAKIIEIVKVSKIIPIYKDGQEANAINVINFNFDDDSECGYNVIAQKGLYKLGDKAIYIQPDNNLSNDITLFDSFTKPLGDPNKTKLGKNNRIRAIKFNFGFDTSNNGPIYSFGILLPFNEVSNYIKLSYNIDITQDTNLEELLQVTKYEEPESGGNGLSIGGLPSFLYATDETNSQNLVSHINKVLLNNPVLGITYKTDGSSFTCYFKKDNDGNFYAGVCSRNQEKTLIQNYVDKYINNGNEYHKYINPVTKEHGWYCDNLQDYKPNEEVKGYEQVLVDVKDSWVDLANSTGLLEKGLEYCKKHNIELAFRGEIYGQGLRGSGNNLNPDSKDKQSLILFGLDTLESGRAIRLNYSDTFNLKNVCEELELPYTKSIEVTPKSYNELIDICNNIFEEQKSIGRIIEGVVVRTMHSNDLSCKVMNAYYDSKK